MSGPGSSPDPVEVVVAPVAGTAVNDPSLRDQLLDLWVAVTDAGGSVGFAAPADPTAIAAALDAELALVRDGRHLLGVVRSDDRVIAVGYLWGRGNPLFAHWRTVMRLMVHPDHQGTGLGGRLLEGLHDLARDDGCEHVVLSIRGGEGLESFYERHGYHEVGRHPGAVRMPDGTDRDEIMFLRPLPPGMLSR
ncbi:MAG: GNAT family N-acetyltransferase [Actinobacteria bacterium]|nr:GNAT family N-acetyltransferase [Actinomycetota bacterium]